MIRAAKNQYFGVNAHANSWMQNRPNGWRGFHHDHITDITRALNAVLPAGYIALSEESLDGEIDEDKLAASIIYEVIADEIGKPVTRIELLSPTNKRPYEGYEQYREKRNVSLQSGVPLIEIDYLHQQPSIDKRLRHYPNDPDSHAYSIIVRDPRPNVYKGTSHALIFDVDQPIPTVIIPLSAGQSVDNFDLGAVYNRTFQNSPAFHVQIDYAMLPDQFEAFSTDDQQHIRDRMQIIQQAAESGRNLDVDGPFPVVSS